VWRNENRGRYDRSRLRYPSDLTDQEWGLTEALVPPFDGGYQGPDDETHSRARRPRGRQAIGPTPKASSFMPKRWIAERTLAWHGRCRRLAKDWECLNRKALAFLRLASIRLMLRRLCNPA
jgi:transposase